MNEALITETLIHAGPDKIWKALTEKSEMKQWYFDLDNFKAEPGFEFRFNGQGSKGENYMHVCKVLEAIPAKKLKYSWTYEGYPGYSEIAFELIPEGDQTRVIATHTGLDSFPKDNPDFARASFKEGWNEIITRMLPDYLKGKTA